MKNLTKRLSLLVLGIATLATCASSVAYSVKGQEMESVSAAAIFTPAKTYANHDGATYYSGISSALTGTDLLSALQALNKSKRHLNFDYHDYGTSSTTSPYIYTDYDPASAKTDKNGQPYSTTLLSFYSGKTCTSYNKEHVWPDSRSGNLVEDDIFMPRPTIQIENSKRGNSTYKEGMNDGSKGWDPVQAFKIDDPSVGCYESIRGESARIIFYCMIANNTLILSESTSYSKNNHTMGVLSDLLKWNLENPVNQREKNRNEGGEYLQGNRNAFVDHPEYACKIWGNTNDSTKKICANQSYDSVSLDRSEKEMKVGESFTLVATASDGSKNFVWSTTNEKVAVVNNGSVTAKAAGVATISVSTTIKGKTYSATCLVTVSDGSGTATTTGDGTISSPYTVSDSLVIPQDGTQYYVTGYATDIQINGDKASFTMYDKNARVPVSDVLLNGHELTDNCSVTIKTSITGNKYIGGFVYLVSTKQPDPGKEKNGCGASIVTSSVILFSSALAGLTLVVVRKKKKEDEE